ncbi:dimethylsulfonioproprionate lyase family protein [Mesorhizobium sp. SP-1A]|uniref:dimethylsulfonioproprionate lyase family protein n=1 Tax=Mesorhizobium sp. SP-1A TaxID=3077840 RepID=UPI0028F6EAEA|nr:dimethylsulfonioproprionate lyase family protein [Mesorhizobium sp. SP-1A]
MALRSEAFQQFIDAALAAFGRHARDPESRRTIRQISAALETPGVERSGPGRRLPTCSHLEGALAAASAHEALRPLVERFKALEPRLQWSNRSEVDASASRNFASSHANAMIVGPGGLEARKDIWLGVSLLAPNVRYPDHDHAPEEVYLVLSEGEFWHGKDPWFSPGIGGSFYNEPGIRHAMRSGDKPLFAFWALQSA